MSDSLELHRAVQMLLLFRTPSRDSIESHILPDRYLWLPTLQLPIHCSKTDMKKEKKKKHIEIDDEMQIKRVIIQNSRVVPPNLTLRTWRLHRVRALSA